MSSVSSRLQHLAKPLAAAGVVCVLAFFIAFKFNVGGIAAGTKRLLMGSGAQPTAVGAFLNRVAPSLFPTAAAMMAPPTGPGGVGTNLQLWLRADTGTSTTTDGAAINQWNDQSSSNNNAVQGTATNQPAYRNNATDNINFNPMVRFDGSNDKMTLNGTLLPLGTTGRSIVGVAKMTGTSSSYLQWGLNGTGTAYSLEMPAAQFSIDSGNSVWGRLLDWAPPYPDCLQIPWRRASRCPV